MARCQPDDDYHDHYEFETCWACHGEGGWHDCGEDCCPCRYPELSVICPECEGHGRYRVIHADHSKDDPPAQVEELAITQEAGTNGEAATT